MFFFILIVCDMKQKKRKFHNLTNFIVFITCSGHILDYTPNTVFAHGLSFEPHVIWVLFDS